jgi:hypothetical protein
MSESVQSRGKNPLREIVQPFIDVVHAPRALWGVNFGYLVEGMIYFGVLGYLAISTVCRLCRPCGRRDGC